MQCDHQHPEVPCRLPENEDEFLSKTWPPVPQPQPWCAHEVRRKLRIKLTPNPHLQGEHFMSVVWSSEIGSRSKPPWVLLWSMMRGRTSSSALRTTGSMGIDQGWGTSSVSGPCSTTAPHPSCAPTQASRTSSMISTGAEHALTSKDRSNHATFIWKGLLFTSLFSSSSRDPWIKFFLQRSC